jgi:hypothetical protein
MSSLLDRNFLSQLKFGNAKFFAKRFPQTENFCASMTLCREKFDFVPPPAHEQRFSAGKMKRFGT